MYRFVNIYADAGQNGRCVLQLKERCSLLLGQMITWNFMLFDLIFLMKNILDKVSEAERAGGRGERRHQRDEEYLILLPWWVLVTQLSSGCSPLQYCVY